MNVLLAVVGVVLAVVGIALSAYLKISNVDMTALRLFLTYPVLSMSASALIGIGGAFLKLASK